MTKWTSSWTILILRTSRRSWQPLGRKVMSIQKSLQRFCAQWGSRPRDKSVGDTMFGIPGPLLSGILLPASGRPAPALRGAPKSAQNSSLFDRVFQRFVLEDTSTPSHGDGCCCTMCSGAGHQ
eukprot:8136749-Pyramimonas_sp.AAC.1